MRRSGRSREAGSLASPYPDRVDRAPRRREDPKRGITSRSLLHAALAVLVSPDGRMRSVGKAKVGKAPKRVAFLPVAAP